MLYSTEWEEPQIIIPLDQIASLDVQYHDSFFNDTIIYVTTLSGLEVSFPVSSEKGLDKRVVEALEEKLNTKEDAAEEVLNR